MIVVYGSITKLIVTPAAQGQHVHITTAMPWSWEWASQAWWFLALPIIGTVFAMLVGRARNLIPRHVVLAIAILASIALVCAAHAALRLHAIKTIDTQDFTLTWYDNTVPLELSIAPVALIAGFSLVTLGAWRLWCVARTIRLENLRELAQVEHDLARQAGDLIPPDDQP